MMSPVSTLHIFLRTDSHCIQLRNFANATRQLGSSAGILSSAFYLRERLAHVSYLYTENAADLFPRLIKPSPQLEAVDVGITTMQSKKRPLPRNRVQAHFSKPTMVSQIDLEDFPKQFDMLADDITTFLDCLNEFPEFNDEAVNSSINSFASDLKVLASSVFVFCRHVHPIILVLVFMPGGI